MQPAHGDARNWLELDHDGRHGSFAHPHRRRLRLGGPRARGLSGGGAVRSRQRGRPRGPSRLLVRRDGRPPRARPGGAREPSLAARRPRPRADLDRAAIRQLRVAPRTRIPDFISRRGLPRRSHLSARLGPGPLAAGPSRGAELGLPVARVVRIARRVTPNRALERNRRPGPAECADGLALERRGRRLAPDPLCSPGRAAPAGSDTGDWGGAIPLRSPAGGDARPGTGPGRESRR